MRGTTDRAAFDDFVKAVAGFPPTQRNGKKAQQVFEESYLLLDQLVKQAPFPRAKAWKAYALALSVSERWQLPKTADEEPLDDNTRLQRAHDLCAEAIKEEETDYDLHWAMADIHLMRQKFPEAVDEFEKALYYDGDARHPSLFVEAATAMMQAGEFEKAEAYFRKAGTPDWHRWARGIYLYLKAGRASSADRETFLDLALDELKATRAQLGDDFYQSEIQLVLAAVYWRKAELLADRARGIGDPIEQARVNRIAARNGNAATRTAQVFKAAFPHWKAGHAVASLPLSDGNDQRWWEDAMNAVVP